MGPPHNNSTNNETMIMMITATITYLTALLISKSLASCECVESLIVSTHLGVDISTISLISMKSLMSSISMMSFISMISIISVIIYVYRSAPQVSPKKESIFSLTQCMANKHLLVTDQLYPRLKVSSITGEINLAAVRMLCSASYLQSEGEELSTRSTPSSSASSSSSSSSTLDIVLCLQNGG